MHLGMALGPQILGSGSPMAPLRMLSLAEASGSWQGGLQRLVPGLDPSRRHIPKRWRRMTRCLGREGVASPGGHARAGSLTYQRAPIGPLEIPLDGPVVQANPLVFPVLV